MFGTTQDILFIVLGFCVLVLTGFLAWVLYYLANILRQTNEMIAEFRVKMEELSESLDNLKEKVMASAASISFVAKEVGNIMTFIKGMKGSKTKKKK